MSRRLLLVLGFFALWIGGIGARLVQLQVYHHEALLVRGRSQHERRVELEPPRGTIFDRRGRKLAVSLEADSAYLAPDEIEDPREATGRLAAVLGEDGRRIRALLQKDKHFVFLRRQLDEALAARLRALELPGLGFVKESRRSYPYGTLGAQVLGFVGTDNDGLHGIEAQYEKVVGAPKVQRTVLKDARGKTVLYPHVSYTDAPPGQALHLTLDASVQEVVEKQLAAALERTSARRATAVLLDPATGAVLAMASLPGFDPEFFQDFSPRSWRNAAVEDAYEPGSTFKVVTAAAALQARVVDPSDVIDCELGGITLASVRIRDHKPFGRLTFREVIARSSNVGAVKVGLMVGPRALHQQARSFGFGSRTGIDLPGESRGILRPLEDWQALTGAYVSFGHGLSVTALQLASAFAAVANGGTLYRPFVVHQVGDGPESRRIAPAVLSRPISAATAHTLERLLEAVVEEGGGGRAAVPGYRVAGKTGTAQKVIPGEGYSSSRHVASFAGFAPARDPAVVAVVVLDEPVGLFYGGLVAAPVFSAILAEVLPYLGVPPDRTLLEAPTPPGPRLARVEPGGDRPPETVMPEVTPEGGLPDLTGLTSRQALARVAELGLHPRLQGWGWVWRQEPSPGTPLEGAAGEVRLWLDESAARGAGG